MSSLRFSSSIILNQVFCSCRSNLRNKNFIRRLSSDNKDSSDPPYAFSDKYKIFKDEDSNIIFDVEEERIKKQNKVDFKVENQIDELEVENRATKTLDIRALVELIKFNKGKDICVINMPPELKYVNFMVIVTGTSRRHLIALAEIIRKEYKVTVNRTSPPQIEGANSEWLALDLGDVAVHLMKDSIRELYDLESLWGVGPRYDVKLNAKEDQTLELLKKHTIRLDDFEPVVEKPNV